MWSEGKINELLSEYNFRDRIDYKTSYGYPNLLYTEEETLLMIKYGKYANSYNIDINKYLGFIDLKDRFDIKRKHNIPLDDSDYSLLTVKNYDLLTAAEIDEILLYTFKNKKDNSTDLSKYIDIIPIEKQINFKKLYAVELSYSDQYYLKSKEEAEEKRRKEIEELNKKREEEKQRKAKEESWNSFKSGCLWTFVIIIGLFCMLIRFLL